MIGIIVPAHNEEEQIEDGLHSLLKAATHPELHAEAFQIIVLLDDCQDKTGSPVSRLKVGAVREACSG